MGIGWVIAILLGLLFVILGSGTYIAVGLSAVGIFGLEFLVHLPGMISNIIYNAAWSYVLLAVPLFVFMGEVIFYSGISQKLYSGVSKLTRIIPGGLLHSNIVSCALFAAISGSSVATSGTVGAVAYPEQSDRGYDRRLITGSLAAGGTLGILIPPSIIMIIYGAFVGVSVGRLFLGGIVPGILLAFLFMGYMGIRTIINPSLAESRVKVGSRRYLLDATSVFQDLWPVLLIMATIFGGIYGGFMTPTEAAAVGAFEAMVLAAAFRKLNFALLQRSSLSALRTTSFVVFIIVGAKIMGVALSMLKVPAQLCDRLAALDVSPLIIWFAVVLLYLILGCFLEGLSLMLLTLPVTFPLVVDTLRFDPIWFGVTLVLLIECAMITPPLGINVYVLHGISGGTNIMEVFRGCFPFFICMMVVIVLLTFIPDLALFLPNLIMGD